MFPNLVMLHPGIANSILQYRYNRIAGAEQKAQSYVGMNYTGTMFPWESAFTGEETCPSWAATGEAHDLFALSVISNDQQFRIPVFC